MENPVHEQHFVGRILPGMDVCDVSGDKVGSVAHIHHVSEPSDSAEVAGHDELLEVKTGLFGLGKHLYVPVHDVQEVLRESIFLSRPREQFDTLGYYAKPSQIS